MGSLGPAAAIGAATLLAALFGIETRSAGFIAAFWPANAIVLGMMVRWPSTSSILGWLAVITGFLFADFITGSTPEKAFILTTSNLAGIGVGLVAIRSLLSIPERRLPNAASVMKLLLATVIAATAAGLTGGVANVRLFDGEYLEGFRVWFTAELACLVVILPVVLTAPMVRRKAEIAHLGRTVFTKNADMWKLLAVLTVTVGIGTLIGGPAAIALPLPVLLWCAMRGSVFETAVLSAIWVGWTLIATSEGFYGSTVQNSTTEIESLQLGLAMLTLGPIVASAAISSRNELMKELKYAAARDKLTGLLGRSTFLNEAEALFRELADEDRWVAVLMIDIDHFKEVNDNHGHAAGDSVLASFGQLVSECLRDQDLAGRTGGEEFMAVLPDADRDAVGVVAERIRALQEANHADDALPGSRPVTVSIGAVSVRAVDAEFADIARMADQAMYEAKKAGRNRVSVGLPEEAGQNPAGPG